MSGNSRPFSRRRLFPLAAILLSFLPLVAGEGLCRLFGWGEGIESQGDPFVGFAEVRPLFTLDEEKGRFEIPPHRHTYFRPDSFSAVKGEEEFRIFCLGGSTVQGRPFEPATAFSTWLELSLRAAAPGKTWEVVNCGGISYASYRLAPILEEVLAYSPDLLILYTGHNEFLEDRTYARIKDLPRPITGLVRFLLRFRLVSVVRKAIVAARRESPKNGEPLPDPLSVEVDARLDRPDGLDLYQRDPEWTQGVFSHFHHNLDRMVALANQAGVPLILVDPVSNLRDTPPFKSQHRSDLTESERRAFYETWRRGRNEAKWNKPQAIHALREAIEIDDEFAALHWELGHFLDEIGSPDEALNAYRQAKELDVCPLRAPEPIHEILATVASTHGVELISARDHIGDLSRDGIPGNDWLLDHVHPTIQGHQEIARLLFDAMVRRGLVGARSLDEELRQNVYAEQIDSLGPAYFSKGMARLERLQRWTRERENR